MVEAREWSAAQGDRQAKQRARNLETEDTMEDDVTTCNTDAAWDLRSQEAGLVWICSRRRGQEEFQGGAKMQNIRSPLMAEALAVIEGMVRCRAKKVEKIQILSDSLALIQAIKSKASSKEIYGVLSAIEKISRSFIYVNFKFVPRKSNGLADGLTKKTLPSCNNFI